MLPKKLSQRYARCSFRRSRTSEFYLFMDVFIYGFLERCHLALNLRFLRMAFSMRDGRSCLESDCVKTTEFLSTWVERVDVKSKMTTSIWAVVVINE